MIYQEDKNTNKSDVSAEYDQELEHEKEESSTNEEEQRGWRSEWQQIWK